ncbi:programmed cell death protein 5 [Halyomorpha halys]|uniref:programmed cell death protein 5 n=1 Tax=Halyomorpha halys TaxID=286706 RepID=UPI0006D4EEA8|nr:programmed cell death protein 5 [Halyomorpha halys]
MAQLTKMDTDPDLQAIRAKRLSEIKGNYKDYNGENPEKAEEEKKRMEDMRNGMLSRILDQNARARLNTIMVAKPDKGRMLENMLIQMAQRGQIMGRMNEDDLKGILEQVNKQFQTKTTVKFDRRRAALDDSDEDLDV